jgi:hypothetical protein
MTNTIGKFDYEVIKMGKSDELPFDPIIHLCLRSYGSTTKDGAPTLSPNLMTDREIDEYIQALKNDLDAVGKKAKRALESAKQRTRELLEQPRTS